MTQTTTPRIVVQQHPIPDSRGFHVNASLGTPEEREQLAATLSGIDGVTQAMRMNQYAVQVMIGLAFDWDPIELQIVDAVANHLGWTGEYIRVDHSTSV